MTEVYLKARQELITMIRARGSSEDECKKIKKEEVYEVIRGMQMGCIVGTSDTHFHSDIFVIGCCVLWEDAVRFNFIGKATIPVEAVVDTILAVRVDGP